MRRMKQGQGRMMTWASLVLFGIFLFWGTSEPAFPQADFSRLIAQITPAVVYVEIPGIGSASGFIAEVVGPDGRTQHGIITSCHVASDAPRDIRSGLRMVRVVMRAWKEPLALDAAVVTCDVAHDAALLKPVWDGQVKEVSDFFRTLASTRRRPELANFPRLWLGDSDQVRLAEGCFALGYPGPYTELVAAPGAITGFLPRHYVKTGDLVFRVSALAIYTVTPKGVQVHDIVTVPGVRLKELTEWITQLQKEGFRVLLVTLQEPLWDAVAGWDVIEVREGLAYLEEREVALLDGHAVRIGRRIDRLGTLALERVFLRTSAPINPGNSGGPVINLSGQVIGIAEWSVKESHRGEQPFAPTFSY